MPKPWQNTATRYVVDARALGPLDNLVGPEVVPAPVGQYPHVAFARLRSKSLIDEPVAVYVGDEVPVTRPGTNDLDFPHGPSAARYDPRIEDDRVQHAGIRTLCDESHDLVGRIVNQERKDLAAAFLHDKGQAESTRVVAGEES